MDQEVLDSPLDLSVRRNDIASLVGGETLLVSNTGSSSWSGMTEALQWSDQLLRVQSLITLAQLEDDWGDEDKDRGPWRFEGGSQVFTSSEEDIRDETDGREEAQGDSRSLEVGAEFHIFGPGVLPEGSENCSAADYIVGERTMSSNNSAPEEKRDFTDGPPVSRIEQAHTEDCFGSDIFANSDQPYVVDSEVDGELLLVQESLPAPPRSQEQATLVTTCLQSTSIGAFTETLYEESYCDGSTSVFCSSAPEEAAFSAFLGSNHFEGEELVVTHVSLLPNSEDQGPEQTHFDFPSQDVQSLVDGIAFNELVVIECQTPCQEYNHLVFEEERGQPSKEGCYALREEAGPELSQNENSAVDGAFKQGASSDCVPLSEVCVDVTGKRKWEESLLVQCWKGSHCLNA